MKIIKIISEWKKNPKEKPVKKGYKRVEAIVEDASGFRSTKHIDIKKGEK